MWRSVNIRSLYGGDGSDNDGDGGSSDDSGDSDLYNDQLEA